MLRSEILSNTIVAATVIDDQTIQVKYPSFQVSVQGYEKLYMIICYTKDKQLRLQFKNEADAHSMTK